MTPFILSKRIRLPLSKHIIIYLLHDEIQKHLNEESSLILNSSFVQELSKALKLSPIQRYNLLSVAFIVFSISSRLI